MLILLLTACVTDEPTTDTTGDAPEACISPVIIDYTCRDGTSYTFPDALPVMVTQLVERDDRNGAHYWQTRALDVRPGYTWNADEDTLTDCDDDVFPPVVGGRLVLAFE